jgi:hypothetical protein
MEHFQSWTSIPKKNNNDIIVFLRYGSPGNVTKEYNAFAEWYLKAFSGK